MIGNDNNRDNDNKTPSLIHKPVNGRVSYAHEVVRFKKCLITFFTLPDVQFILELLK